MRRTCCLTSSMIPTPTRCMPGGMCNVRNIPYRTEFPTRFAASVVMEITYGKVTPTSYSDPEVIAVNRCLVRFGQAIVPEAYLVDTYLFLRRLPGYLTRLRKWHQEELALFEGQLDTVRKQMVIATRRHRRLGGLAHPSRQGAQCDHVLPNFSLRTSKHTKFTASRWHT